ncbi:MAG: MerR family transcriptional regulator [Thiohalobacterales bacterium]|nr:MerR family transcriptional regulator [Thiohalobacterales bacterium]
MKASTQEEQTYRIGTVARLTGISPDTLRVWERRYGVVQPLRSAGGDRGYTRAHIERLRLIKRLVDGGDAIGSIAGLDTEALRERSLPDLETDVASVSVTRGPCRIVVVGETLAGLLQAEADGLDDIELVASKLSMDALLADHHRQPADVLVIEMPTVHDDTTRQIVGWLEDAGAQKALVVYRFATADALQRLPAARIQTVRAPVTPIVIRNLCLGMRPVEVKHPGPGEADPGLSVFPRQFTTESLARLALISPAMKCECPRHLAELITDLVAFERYSAECENRNAGDAALHAYLHATASHARTMIEDALAHVIEIEGIELDS